jgi:hypothetical protein
VTGEQAHLRAERRRLRRVGGAESGGARFGNLKPRDGGRHRPHRGVDDERRGQAEALGEGAAGQRADADGEDEDALIDRYHAAAVSGGRDVGEDDLPRHEHQRGADARDEAPQDEHHEARRHGADQISGGGYEAAECQRCAPPDDVGQASDGHRDEEAGETVHGDGEPDRRLRHAERARVEREHGHDAAEAELVDGDKHASIRGRASGWGRPWGARLSYNPPTHRQEAS